MLPLMFFVYEFESDFAYGWNVPIEAEYRCLLCGNFIIGIGKLSCERSVSKAKEILSLSVT